MKVAELQQFLSTIVPFARAAGASQTATTDLERAVDCLEPFKGKTLAEFNDFLRLADEYVRTGTLPASTKAAGKPRAPKSSKSAKLTVADAAQKFLSLYERATDPTLDYALIDAEIDTFNSLTVANLKEVAQQVNKTLPAKLKKKDEILAEFKRKIKEQKESHERTQFRTTEATPAAASAKDPDDTL